MNDTPQSSAAAVTGEHKVKVVRSVSIALPADQLYAFWRDPKNLMQVVKHPVTIESITRDLSHWTVSKPLSDDTAQWDSSIINDQPGKMIAWRSNAGGEIANAGTVWFTPAPGEEGTEVTVKLEFDPPGGKIAAFLAKLSPESPDRQLAEALRRFKALMEAGEIPTTEGQSVGEPQKSKNQS